MFTLERKSFLMDSAYVQNSAKSVGDWENIRGKFAATLVINLYWVFNSATNEKGFDYLLSRSK